jgi:radical SAM protein with 4Fe4S-binding SPASM domain
VENKYRILSNLNNSGYFCTDLDKSDYSIFQLDSVLSLALFEPDQIDIMLSTDCNLQCVNCIRKDVSETKSIDFARTIDLITNKKNKKEYLIHFTGGEPFLKIDKLKNTLAKIITLNNRNFSFSTYSNLILLNHEIIELIKQYDLALHISLDGYRTGNDSVRGKGSFKKVIDNISLLHKENISVSSITTTLKNVNFDIVSHDFIKLLKRFKVSTWRINVDYFGIDAMPETIVNTLFSLYTNAIMEGINIEGSWLYPFQNLITNNKTGFCPATKGETITLFSNGLVGLCPYCDTIIGSSTDCRKILNERFHDFKRDLIEISKCGECIIKDYCHTHCLVTRQTNNSTLVKWYCEIYRGITLKLLNYGLQN